VLLILHVVLGVLIEGTTHRIIIVAIIATPPHVTTYVCTSCMHRLAVKFVLPEMANDKFVACFQNLGWSSPLQVLKTF
jgi:hypothetical protein